jgi:hypothetical protein
MSSGRSVSSFSLLLAALALLMPSLAMAAGPAKSSLFAPWIDGTNASEPITQVQQVDPDTFVTRQSIKTNFEGPFLYLLFGTDKALLLDSGAGGLEIRPTIDKLIAEWCARNGRTSIIRVTRSSPHGRIPP